VLEAGRSLAGGRVTPQFTLLRDRLVEALRPLLAGVDVCIVHNAATLHKNLPLTAALKELSDRKIARFVSWSHDLAWMDPLYQSEMNTGYPWNLMSTPWGGVAYVAVSHHRRKLLASLLGLPEPGSSSSSLLPAV
jgi:hypothetical protein